MGHQVIRCLIYSIFVLNIMAADNWEIFVKVLNCENQIFPNNAKISTKAVKFRNMCALLCLADSACGTYAYNKKTQDCYLSNGIFPSCGDLQLMDGVTTYKVNAVVY